MTELDAITAQQRNVAAARRLLEKERSNLVAEIRLALSERYKATEIARTLGISRTTLYRWLGELPECGS